MIEPDIREVKGGFLDIHTHDREPGCEYKEDFKHLTRAAIHQGVVDLGVMPNNTLKDGTALWTVSPARMAEKRRLASGNIYCNVMPIFGAILESVQYFDAVAKDTSAFKLYMGETTGGMIETKPYRLDKIFANIPPGIRLIVHAEGETFETALFYAKKYHVPLHLAHASEKQQLEGVISARSDGVDVTCEVAPHHIFLNKKDLPRLKGFGMMKPPLPSEEDQDAIRYYLAKNPVIDMIATDHASHTLEEKQNENPRKIPSGVPGLDTVTDLMMDAVNEGWIGFGRVIELMRDNPRRIFRVTEPPGTRVFIDMNKRHKLGEVLFTKCGWTPFQDREVTGKVVRVDFNGRVVFENDRVVGPPGGKMIHPLA